MEERIQVRLGRFIRSWPTPMAEAFESYRSREGSPGAAPGSRQVEGRDPVPYWMSLPRWLAVAHGGCEPGFLGDVLWAQYALFMAIRIQDDLYDGQAEHPELVYVADQFLLEADRVIEARFPRATRMRRFVRKSLETTTRAIVEVDAAQRAPGGLGSDALRGYAKVAEIFKVGSAAVCMKLGRASDLRHIGIFADGLAVAGQILDDLNDMEEDLRRGRLNFAATVLLRDAPPGVASQDEQLERIVRNLMVSDGTDVVLNEARKWLRSAYPGAEALALQPALEYLDDVGRRIDAVDSDLHRAQVKRLFASL